MRARLQYRKLWIGLIILASAGIAHADDDPLKDPSVQKTLRAMSDASTWGHPDQFGEFAGMRYYAHHQYKDAMKYFDIGAYYADKLSQLSIGLLYLNGEGVAKDPVTAYAWMSIAAERAYPDFVATRDGVKASLTPEQLQKADAIRQTLDARYGDAVAKPRMVKQLRMAQMEFTGSRTGFDSGVTPGHDEQPVCGPAVVVAERRVRKPVAVARRCTRRHAGIQRPISRRATRSGKPRSVSAPRGDRQDAACNPGDKCTR